MRLVVSNPLTAPYPGLTRSGGGHGLVGMGERFAALSHGGSATATSGAGRFTVTAEAAL